MISWAGRVHESLTASWGQTHRFVGPVVLLKDFLCTILPTICKHHYHLIAVGPRGAALLWHKKREKGEDKSKEREGNRRVRARMKGGGDDARTSIKTVWYCGKYVKEDIYSMQNIT